MPTLLSTCFYVVSTRTRTQNTVCIHIQHAPSPVKSNGLMFLLHLDILMTKARHILLCDTVQV